MEIIGREKEQALLKSRYHSGRPEFVAVYGQRRVGKTYLGIASYHGHHLRIGVQSLQRTNPKRSDRRRPVLLTQRIVFLTFNTRIMFKAQPWHYENWWDLAGDGHKSKKIRLDF